MDNLINCSKSDLLQTENFEFESQINPLQLKQMSLILGTIVREQIQIENHYFLQILTQIKHYLTLQTNIVLKDNDHGLKIIASRRLFSNQLNESNQFHIPKNFSYLFTHWQRISVQNQEDLEFFDVCYQCLMIIKEYLPTKISIGVQIIEDMNNEIEGGTQNSPLSLVDFVQNFENQKNEEFSRRINSNFKSLVSPHENQVSKFQVQNLLHLSEHFYYYKNKFAALKFLSSHQKITNQVWAELDQKYVDFLKQLSIDEDFRGYANQVLAKIQIAKEINQNKKQSQMQSYQSQCSSKEKKGFQKSNFSKLHPKDHLRNTQKQFRLSNNENVNIVEKKNRQALKSISKLQKGKTNVEYLSQKEDKFKNISVKSLLFQLRESQSLKRLSMLIKTASEMKIEEEKYEMKIKKQIQNICKKFLKQSYRQRYPIEDRSSRVQHQSSPQYHRPTDEQIDEVTKFYESLEAYFTRNDASKKSEKNQKSKIISRSKNESEQSEGNPKYKSLLDKICHKIQHQYYGQ